MMTPSMTTPSLELPVLGTQPTPRADAARNRALILATAQRLFRERGVDAVSMDAIACAAGVGKGTLFRRFGDRPSLVRALLEDCETEFQESFIRGEPPLGPGAPPVERLVAFGVRQLERTEEHGEWLLAAETGSPGQRFRTSVYPAYRAHILMLIRAAGRDADAEYLADVLLASLGAELVMHQLRGRGLALDELRSGWESLARCVLA